ncbi:MAG: cytochrome c [Betaproteobacteria bacterium]|nr:cytochrome c [Betaproteobacteria bacterium]
MQLSIFSKVRWGALIGAVLFLSACGGGDGSTGPAAAKTLTGVAATGSPVVGEVLLKDSSPSPVHLKAATASDGSFAFNTAGLTPPFMIKTTVAASNLYSLAADSGIYNLTPLTTMAVAQAAGGADLDALYSNHVQTEINAAAAKMSDAVAALHKNLAPLLEQYGVTANILTGQFSANHTGVDALLDAVAISIAKGTVTITNKQNNALVFAAPCTNLAAGSVITGNLPSSSGTPAPASGTSLYTAKCAGCHGAISSPNFKGTASIGAIQSAIAANRGGMGMLSGISTADLQSISDALLAQPATPPAAPPAGSPTTPPVTSTPDGAALYTANCAGCHGALASSSKGGITTVRLQNAISGNVGGMGALASLSAADMQAIASALNPSTPPPTPTPTPVPTPTPTPTPGATPDGAALYATHCAGCHGALAASAKQGITIARLQSAINNGIGNMGSLSKLSVTEVQAIVTALTPTTPTPTPNPTPSPTPTPSPAPACGSCHSIPPATGHHAKHRGEGISCATCHGTGYGTTSASAATHNDGTKNVVGNTGWNAASRSCSNSCHKSKAW